MKNVVIGVLSGDMVHADFAFSLTNLGIMSTIKFSNEFRIVGIINHKSSVIDDGRNTLVTKANGVPGATHLLMIDSDMTFAPDLLKRLLDCNKAIVGVDASTRQEPVRRTARKVGDKWELGAGVLLIEMSVFAKLEFPWFYDPYVPTQSGKPTRLGEDYYFCRNANEDGIAVHCAQDVKVGHIGQKVYGVE